MRAWSNELLVVIATIVMFGVQPVRVQSETAKEPTYDRPNIGEAEAFFKRILETRKQAGNILIDHQNQLILIYHALTLKE